MVLTRDAKEFKELFDKNIKEFQKLFEQNTEVNFETFKNTLENNISQLITDKIQAHQQTMAGKEMPTLDKFSGQDSQDASIWMANFELYSELADYKEQKVKYFPFFLKDKALTWYSALDEDSKKDFTKVKKEFTEWFDNSDSKMSLERAYRGPQGSQTVDEYISKVKRYGRRLGKDDNDIAIALQLGFNPEVKKFVFARGCKSLESTIEAAREAAYCDPDPSVQLIAANIDSWKQDLKEELKREMQSLKDQNTHTINLLKNASKSFRSQRGGHRGRGRGGTRGGYSRQGDSRHHQQSSQCMQCGGKSHSDPNRCKAINQRCHKCSCFGHFARMCRSMPINFMDIPYDNPELLDSLDNQ